MGLFSRLSQSFRAKASQPSASTPTLPPQPPQPLSITELERQMAAEAKAIQPYSRPLKTYPIQKVNAFLGKLMWMAILIGVPLGGLWLVNLPYPIIRRPVADKAPILLLPSYMKIDNSYRQAIALVEEADQLIGNPTSASDIERGEQILQQAQGHLDQLPIWFLSDFPEYRYWWYSWRFSYHHFNTSRARLGELKAKVFQENNAQTALFNAEENLKTAQQTYQQAATTVDKQLAIAKWQSALDQMGQIPGQTLAGQTAQQKTVAYERDFQTIVGLAAGNDRINALLRTAQQFGKEAAQASQNSPHTVEEWQRIETLWEEAITWLERIPETDLAGYAEASGILVTYRSNLEEIRVRRQQEATAVRLLEAAKKDIVWLQRISNNNYQSHSRGEMIGTLQEIINHLEAIPNGTTAYGEAQQLLIFAKNKLNQTSNL